MKKVSVVFLLGLMTCLLLHPEPGWTMARQQGEGSIVVRGRNPFTSEEDTRLASLVQQFGTNNWEEVAARMESRTTRQCRERWRNYLAPHLHHTPFTREECDHLFWKVRESGPHWNKIAQNFPGRSGVELKNAYGCMLRRMRVPRLWARLIQLCGASQSVSPRVGGTLGPRLPEGYVDGIDSGWDSLSPDSPLAREVDDMLRFDLFGGHVDDTGFELGGLSLADLSPADRLEGFGEHPSPLSNRDSSFPGSP